MNSKPTRLVMLTNDPERAAMVEQTAATQGWQVLPCVRRPVPFELLDHLRVDLFLVDLDLETALDQIRELARRPGAKVIALASPERMADWHQAIQAGVKEFLTFPLDPRQLITTIDHLAHGTPAPAGPVQPGQFAGGQGYGVQNVGVQNVGAPNFGNQNLAGQNYGGQAYPGQPMPSMGAGLGTTPSPTMPMSDPRSAQAPFSHNQSSYPAHPQSNGAYPPQSPNGYANGGQPIPGQPIPGQPMPGQMQNGYAPSYPAQPGYAPNPPVHAGQHVNGANHAYANGALGQGAPDAGGCRLIALVGLRGGVGRSTIAANLAVALRQRSGANVILTEAHHNPGHLSLMLNLLPRHTLASLTDAPAVDSDMLRGMLQQHSSGVQLLAAPVDVNQLAELTPETWRTILSELKQMAQYVVVDTSSIADVVLSEVLTAADDILIICGPDILSMRSTVSLLDTLRSERDNVRGRVQVMLNRAGVRGGLDESTLQKQFREKIAISFPEDVPLATYSLNRGVPFVLSHGRSALTRSINTIVDQFTARSGAQAQASAPRKPFALLPLLSRN